MGLGGFISHVGSFNQQIGHQSYNLTDDLRAICWFASTAFNETGTATDDVRARLVSDGARRLKKMWRDSPVDNYR